MMRIVRRLRQYREDRSERAWQRARNLDRIHVLKAFIPLHGTGAELGVHKGHFSPLLLEHFAPVKLYLIDPWYLQGTHWSWGAGNRRTVDGLCSILNTMEAELSSGRVELLIADDLQALSHMPDGHLDWAYLDTTHQYDHTVSELHLLRNKVKPGGVIAGDDWQPAPSHRHHGVYRAVQEFIDRGQGSLLHADQQSTQWAIRPTP